MKAEPELIEKLKAHMQAKKISQIALAEKIDLSQSSVTRFLRGKSIVYETYIKFKNYLKHKREKPPV